MLSVAAAQIMSFDPSFVSSSGCSFGPRSGRSEVPNIIDAVAGCVAGRFVLRPSIERLAFVGPLFAAIIPRDERKTSRRGGVGIGDQRRPIDGTLRIARRLAGAVAVEHV